MDYWEKFFIAALKTKSPYGYNLTDGGTKGWEHTPETCAKISVAHKGKKFSPEHCANLSIAQTERFKDPNEREKISAAKTGAKHPFFGKHHTPEHCANISEALTGRVLSPEHCANISAAKINNPLSPEICNRLATTRRGKTRYKNLLSELECRKLSYHRLAKIMSVSYSSVSAKMLGRRNFTERDKKKLVEIFNKPIEFLLKRNE